MLYLEILKRKGDVVKGTALTRDDIKEGPVPS